MTHTPIVSGIYIYPVKSCRGIELASASLDAGGLMYDRTWLVVDENGRFLTQRQLPRMAVIETALEAESLCLSAPDLPELRLPLTGLAGTEREVVVWRDRCRAVDQGTEAAAWFSRCLGLGCRLVRIGAAYTRPVDPTYAPQPAQVSFADGYPLLVISEASLADLNTRLAEPLPMDRFRPNLVVSGCEAYAEDGWQTVQVGTVTFHGVKLCQRCAITTVDQATGNPGKEPLITLAGYRRVRGGGVVFGQNLIHANLGGVQVGDAMSVLQAQDSLASLQGV